MSDLMGNMQALGIELPSGACVRHDRPGGLPPWQAAGAARDALGGLALMLYTYVVSSTWGLYLVGGALMALAFLDRG